MHTSHFTITSFYSVVDIRAFVFVQAQLCSHSSLDRGQLLCMLKLKHMDFFLSVYKTHYNTVFDYSIRMLLPHGSVRIDSLQGSFHNWQAHLPAQRTIFCLYFVPSSFSMALRSVFFVLRSAQEYATVWRKAYMLMYPAAEAPTATV